MKKLFLYISLISFPLFSQSILFETDTNNLRIGERFNTRVKSYNIDSADVFWVKLDTVFKDFELLNEPIVQTFFEGDTYVYKDFLLTTFDTGTFVFPSSQFLSIYSDSILTNSISVQFLPVELDDTDKIFDIKPVKKIPFLIKELVYYIPHLIIILLLCFLWIYVYKKYRHKNVLSSKKPQAIPIDIYYLTELNVLKSQEYLKHENFKSFYTRLSEIYRGYLEDRFSIPALELDTYNLKILLDSKNLNESWFNDFFRNCDIIKFAKGVPKSNVSMEFLEQVKMFVKQYGVNPSVQVQEDIVQESDIKEEKTKKKIYVTLLVLIPIGLVVLIYNFIRLI